MRNLFLAALLSATSGSWAQAGDVLELPVPGPREARWDSTDLKKFEIRGLNLDKGLVVYRMAYSLFDWSREVDEGNNPMDVAPFYNCKYRDADLGPGAVVEWGLLDLKNGKVLESLMPRKPARKKEECTAEALARKNWRAFERRAKELGVELDEKVKVSKKLGVSPEFRSEVFYGETVVKEFLTLPAELRGEVLSAFCDGRYLKEEDFSKEKREKLGKSEAGMLLLKNGEKTLWAKGFCPNNGAMAPHCKYSFRGYLGSAEAAVALVDVKCQPGAHAGEHFQHRILFSPIFSVI